MEVRKEQIFELRIKGLSYQAISQILGISRQRVHQIHSGYQKLCRSLARDQWYKKIYDSVLTRDNNMCQKCHNTMSKMVVHHIDGDDTNNNPLNLITLCRKCHQNLHNPALKNNCPSLHKRLDKLE